MVLRAARWRGGRGHIHHNLCLKLLRRVLVSAGLHLLLLLRQHRLLLRDLLAVHLRVLGVLLLLGLEHLLLEGRGLLLLLGHLRRVVRPGGELRSSRG